MLQSASRWQGWAHVGVPEVPEVPEVAVVLAAPVVPEAPVVPAVVVPPVVVVDAPVPPVVLVELVVGTWQLVSPGGPSHMMFKAQPSGPAFVISQQALHEEHMPQSLTGHCVSVCPPA
jgi:hypothetical protein